MRRTPGHCHNRRHLGGLFRSVGGIAVFRGDLTTQALRCHLLPTHLPPGSYYLPMSPMPRRLLVLQHRVGRFLLSPKYVSLRTDCAAGCVLFVAVIFQLLVIVAQKRLQEFSSCLRHYLLNRIHR